jgi:hypothetical protein
LSEYIKGNVGIVKKDLIEYIYIKFNMEVDAVLVKAKIKSKSPNNVLIGVYACRAEAEYVIDNIYKEL